MPDKSVQTEKSVVIQIEARKDWLEFIEGQKQALINSRNEFQAGCDQMIIEACERIRTEFEVARRNLGETLRFIDGEYEKLTQDRNGWNAEKAHFYHRLTLRYEKAEEFRRVRFVQAKRRHYEQMMRRFEVNYTKDQKERDALFEQQVAVQLDRQLCQFAGEVERKVALEVERRIAQATTTPSSTVARCDGI